MFASFLSILFIATKIGTLRVGNIIAGKTTYGKVRSLINWKGKVLKEAGPSTPVRVLGLSDTGKPGEIFKKVSSEKEARLIVEKSAEKEKAKGFKKRETSLEALLEEEKKEEEKVLNLIIKTDTQGSLKALSDVLKNLGKKGQKINILHEGVGEIKKSDILLASTSSSLIIGFNIGIIPENAALAKEKEVEIRKYKIIYEIIEDIEKILQGLSQPEFKEIIIGRSEVRENI